MRIKKPILIAVIVLVMINNVEHLAFVHYTLAQHVFPVLGFDWMNKLHSVIVVVIFEIVVITFVIKGEHTFAGLFTCCIFILSLVYYDVPELITKGQYIDVLSATTYSLIFTISIYMFSRMLADEFKVDERIINLETLVNDLRSNLQQSVSKCDETTAMLNDTKTELDHTQNELKEKLSELHHITKTANQLRSDADKVLEKLKCPYCGVQNESEGQLRAHKGHCQHNPQKRHSNQTHDHETK